jgi:hypothetical protein
MFFFRWRVAVLELKAFICDLLQNFRILPVPGVTIVREFHGVSIPKVQHIKHRGTSVAHIVLIGVWEACEGRRSAADTRGFVIHYTG